MVIVRIIGGLGNQLFQYAAGRRLAILHDTNLKLDITSFADYKWHAYSLKPFRIEEQFTTWEEIESVKRTAQKGLAKVISSVNRRYSPWYRPNVLVESGLKPYDQRIIRTAKDVYLNGYWQSDKYFAEIQELIRTEFSIRYEPDHKSQEIGKMIANAQSVSIHVRRGNYVSNPQVNSVHGTCSVEYYQECVKRIGERVDHPHLFVFSDDLSWVRENLRFDYPTTFVDHNDATRDYEDLRLMSMCKHQIIANSSFSWWAAWLNSNPSKLVLAPRRWVRDSGIDLSDLFPSDWMLV